MAPRPLSIAVHAAPSSAAEPNLVRDRKGNPERLPAHLDTEHPTRTAIVTCLEDAPGINLQSLCDAINANRGTATHHLQALNKSGTVASVKSGRETHFFLTRLDRPPLLLRGPIREIAAAVAASGGSIQKTFTQALTMSRRTFRTHMDRLMSHGLVNEIVDGRTRRYYPTQRLQELLENDA